MAIDTPAGATILVPIPTSVTGGANLAAAFNVAGGSAPSGTLTGATGNTTRRSATSKLEKLLGMSMNSSVITASCYGDLTFHDDQ